MESTNDKTKYITPVGHYKIVSTPIKYENGETICVFSAIKIKENENDDIKSTLKK